jgi:hypothetical protein
MKEKGKSKRVEEITVQPTVKVSQERTPDYRENYANSVQVEVSIWDFRLSFATSGPQAASGLFLRTFQAIHMSPQQGKAFHALFGQYLARYEQTFGPINLQAVDAPDAQQDATDNDRRPQ